MTLFVTSKSSATRHGVFGIKATPPSKPTAKTRSSPPRITITVPISVSHASIHSGPEYLLRAY